MTFDYDVLMNLPMHHFYTMQIRIIEMQKLVRHLKEDMEEWGFDSRGPLETDSFTIPKLIQFDADLEYVREGMRKIEKERRANE